MIDTYTLLLFFLFRIVFPCIDKLLPVFLEVSVHPVLSGSTVTTAWRVLCLRIEETASKYGG
jgi:hypothetical protein